MGMDVYGNNPTTPEGEYFRRSVWGWRPLADFVVEMAGAEAAPCKHWHTNDADGLNSRGALALAVRLRSLLAGGHVDAYVANRDGMIALLPREPCTFCDGTGIRRDAVAVKMGQPERVCDALDDGEPHPRAGETGWCNCCNGRGDTAPWAASYHLDRSDVEEFCTFLEGSGGFRIC